MAKQRPQPKPKSPPANAPGAPSAPALSTRASGPGPRRSTYVEAVAVYEKGLEALQRHHYAEALQQFEQVLAAYPDERELHERVRLYLNICRRHVTEQQNAPQTIQERLYASTLALNGGRYDEAIAHLRLVRDEDPDNDHALYMLALAHAQQGEHALAIAHLERAIAMNPENRALARRDPDLDPLRDDEAFLGALDGSASRKAGPRA